jgi:Flp pilus assembly protein CpaB
MKTRIIGAILALVLAVAGAFVLITYVRGADARAAEGAELADVYIVQKDVPKGTSGDAIGEFVKLDQMPQRNIAEDAVTDLAELTGLVADADLLPGEQLLSARFIDPLELAARGEVPVPAGMQEVSFALPTQRVVGGQVKAGSTVGVLVTKTDTSADGAVGTGTSFELDRVLVTRVEIGTSVSSESESSNASRTGEAVMVTVAVSTRDAERLVWSLEGYEDGTVGVWLTLQNAETDTGGSDLIADGNVRQ